MTTAVGTINMLTLENINTSSAGQISDKGICDNEQCKGFIGGNAVLITDIEILPVYPIHAV